MAVRALGLLLTRRHTSQRLFPLLYSSDTFHTSSPHPRAVSCCASYLTLICNLSTLHLHPQSINEMRLLGWGMLVWALGVLLMGAAPTYAASLLARVRERFRV